jgi:hypothetical protein
MRLTVFAHGRIAAAVATVLTAFMWVPIAHADTSTTTDNPNDAGGIGAALAFLTALPFVLGILYWIALIVAAVLVAPPDRRGTFGLLTAFLLGPLGVAAASIAQPRHLPLWSRKKCPDCARVRSPRCQGEALWVPVPGYRATPTAGERATPTGYAERAEHNRQMLQVPTQTASAAQPVEVDLRRMR